MKKYQYTHTSTQKNAKQMLKHAQRDQKTPGKHSFSNAITKQRERIKFIVCFFNSSLAQNAQLHQPCRSWTTHIHVHACTHTHTHAYTCTPKTLSRLKLQPNISAHSSLVSKFIFMQRLLPTQLPTLFLAALHPTNLTY